MQPNLNFEDIVEAEKAIEAGIQETSDPISRLSVDKRKELDKALHAVFWANRELKYTI